MISFKNYFNENINYYNSLTSKTVDMIVNESDLFVKHGKAIDSILYKMSLHNNRIKNNKYIWRNICFLIVQKPKKGL